MLCRWGACHCLGQGLGLRLRQRTTSLFVGCCWHLGQLARSPSHCCSGSCWRAKMLPAGSSRCFPTTPVNTFPFRKNCFWKKNLITMHVLSSVLYFGFIFEKSEKLLVSLLVTLPWCPKIMPHTTGCRYSILDFLMTAQISLFKLQKHHSGSNHWNYNERSLLEVK